MRQPEQAQMIRILAQTDLARSITGFLVDREDRGLSRDTIEYYGEELRHLQTYLERRGVQSVQAVTADALRRYLTQTDADLEQAHRN